MAQHSAARVTTEQRTNSAAVVERIAHLSVVALLVTKERRLSGHLPTSLIALVATRGPPFTSIAKGKETKEAAALLCYRDASR